MRRAFSRVVDVLATIAAGLAVAYALGALFVRLWAPPPTVENSSPPPEAFWFMGGAMLGFAAVVLARVLLRQRAR